MPDGVSMEAWVGIGRMRAPIRIDAPHAIAVSLTQDRDPSGSEQHLERIVRNEHPTGHAGGKTMIDDRERPARLLVGVHFLDLLGDFELPGWRIRLLLLHLVG